MESIFEILTDAVSGAAPVALSAAFAWGVLSILLSPCHLASIPLIVGFIQGQNKPSQRRALALSSLFALGILVTIALIGAITAAAGRLMGDVGTIGNILVAAVFLLVGLIPFGVIGITSYVKSSNALSEAAYGQLKGMRAVKKAQITQFFEEREGDMGVVLDTVAVLKQDAFQKLGAIQAI